MAAKQGAPASALRVLEEALGMDLTAAGDTAEAVAAEGAYYLERILTCSRGLQALPLVTGLGARARASHLGRPSRFVASQPARPLLDLKVASPPPCSPDSSPLKRLGLLGAFGCCVPVGRTFGNLISDDNFSIPEGEEDLAKAIQMVQEQATDIQILEQKTVLPSKQPTPEVIEDFLCNFLIKMGMTRTLDCFQYELIQKGVTELRDIGNVPDVYTQNMLLENENKNLKKDLKHYKQAAEYVL
ncbi:hypothetical protein GH733_008462, partial [Mirounga leonina]